MATGRTHAASRYSTTLTATMSATDLNAAVLTTSGAPASPAYIWVDFDVPTKAEHILMDGTYDGTTLRTTTLANRYLEGSAAASGIIHDAGASVISAPSGAAIEDIWDAIGSVPTMQVGGGDVTSDGNGRISVGHGLGVVPSAVFVGLAAINFHLFIAPEPDHHTATSIGFVLRVRADESLSTNKSVNITWLAFA